MAFPLTRLPVLYFYVIDRFLTRIAFWPCVYVVSFPIQQRNGLDPAKKSDGSGRVAGTVAPLTAISLPAAQTLMYENLQGF